MNFPTEYDKIIERIEEINPEKYASSRNYGDGAVSQLSPYISRGVISTKQVFDHIQTLDLPWYKTEKFVQELGWRDYWQQVWIAKGNDIDKDIKNVQHPITNHQVPKAIFDATTGINKVDESIRDLYTHGHMHNHMRMYVAAITCNMAFSHWLEPAKWLFYNLLDGDQASNQLSWQWVSGAFSNKKYVANQDNINKYFHDNQKGTFLDLDYADFEHFETPNTLKETIKPELITPLPDIKKPIIEDKKTLIYNYYNLDPEWYKHDDLQRILLLEPSFFKENPVNKNCINFILELSKNIPNLKIYIGSFNDLNHTINSENIIYKEHPTNRHYKGTEEYRDWLSTISGYYPSFFSFWKKAKKQLRKE